ncbi:MAG TPA: transcription elongation factor GreA [Clostridia bacterium]|nr:transcription elongation factor GreA [Clostridia bacterium]
MKEVFLTKEGFEELKTKLDYLMSEKRKEIAEKIKIAREFGDISENAEYDAAKEEQVFVEQEIKEIDDKLLHAVIIDDQLSKKVVSIGSTVKVLDVEFNDEMEFRIVGTTEANSVDNKISNVSPLGVALIGRKKNDIIHVVTPNGGTVEYKIISIQ